MQQQRLNVHYALSLWLAGILLAAASLVLNLKYPVPPSGFGMYGLAPRSSALHWRHDISTTDQPLYKLDVHTGKVTKAPRGRDSEYGTRNGRDN